MTDPGKPRHLVSLFLNQKLQNPFLTQMAVPCRSSFALSVWSRCSLPRTHLPIPGLSPLKICALLSVMEIGNETGPLLPICMPTIIF